jgi:hypothetical protein
MVTASFIVTLIQRDSDDDEHTDIPVHVL